jgi:hypothetical protein
MRGKSNNFINEVQNIVLNITCSFVVLVNSGMQSGDEMRTRKIISERLDVSSDNDINSREKRRVGEERLLNHVQERDQLNNTPFFLKYSGHHLLGLVAIPLIVAVCLLLQLHKLPDSSLSYSLLNAIVCLLFNFSSSALLKAFSA